MSEAEILGKGGSVPASVGESPIRNLGLTLEKANDLGFWVFAVAQGNQTIIREALKFVHSRHPDWKISLDFANDIRTELEKSTGRFINNATPHNHTPRLNIVEYSSSQVTGLMREIFNSEEKDYDDKRLFENTVRQNYKYLFIEGGRPGRPKNLENTYDNTAELRDPFLSYLCRYVIEGVNTRVPEYDEMFQEIGELVSNPVSKRRWSDDFKSMYKIVMLIYGRTHPKRIEEFVERYKEFSLH